MKKAYSCCTVRNLMWNTGSRVYQSLGVSEVPSAHTPLTITSTNHNHTTKLGSSHIIRPINKLYGPVHCALCRKNIWHTRSIGSRRAGPFPISAQWQMFYEMNTRGISGYIHLKRSCKQVQRWIPFHLIWLFERSLNEIYLSTVEIYFKHVVIFAQCNKSLQIHVF